MNLNDTKSAETLRKEITQDLDRLDSKVDQLKDRLSPGQIIDDAVFGSYRGNPKASFNYLKDNPVGTTFLAIGTLLLMDNEGESYEHYLKGQSRGVYTEYKGKALDAKNRLSQGVESLSKEVKSKTQHLVEQGEGRITQLRDASVNAKNRVRSKLINKTEEVKDNVIDAAETFRERSAGALESVSGEMDAMETNPPGEGVRETVTEYGRNAVEKMKASEINSYTYLALGGTLGFATGGLIPFSDEELETSKLDFNLGDMRAELQSAANESINIFKNEFIDTLKGSNLDLF